MRMTRGTKVVVVAAAVALAAALAVVLALRRGFSARDEPMAVEAFFARRLRLLAVPRTARQSRNPVPLTDEVLARARAHFADHCAICHGNDGWGRTPIGRNLYPKAPDMTSGRTQSLADGEIFYIIKNGVRLTGMPAWGDDTAESDLQTWHLVHFVRHLPAITEEELGEMEELNPRSLREIREEEMENRFLEGGDVPASPQEHRH